MMVAVSTVIRLPLGLLQVVGDQAGLQPGQEGAVKEERAPFAPLVIFLQLLSVRGFNIRPCEAFLSATMADRRAISRMEIES